MATVLKVFWVFSPDAEFPVALRVTGNPAASDKPRVSVARVRASSGPHEMGVPFSTRFRRGAR